MTEHHIIGPPGAGKTFYLAGGHTADGSWYRGQVGEAVEAYGYDRVLVTSLTKAAVREIVGRDLPIPDSHAATLHSMAWHALGGAQIVNSKAQAEDWNRHVNERFGAPDWEIPIRDLESGSGDDLDDFITPGWLGEANRYRGLMRPRELWPSWVRDPFNAWCDWKRDNLLLDFTDLLERAVDQETHAPGGALAMFVDEAQDMTPLAARLIRQWALDMETLVLVGDPDQCLYEWVGADPAIMHQGYDEIRTLPRSFRLSRAVHAEATEWVARTPGRVHVDFGPTEEGGEAIRDDSLTLGRPDVMLDDILADAERGTVMILASSSYMLRGLIAELRAEGVPFHNPWRLRNGAWNPMAPRKGQSTAERLLSYCAANSAAIGRVGRPWNAADVRSWVPMVKADGVFVHGGKRQLESLPEDADTARVYGAVQEYVEPDALAGVLSGDPEWLRSHAVATYGDRLEYPMHVLDRRGGQALREAPRVIIGTIHSVKGAEADTVYVSPDISTSALNAWQSDVSGEAAIRRTFYVAMSRARSKLVLMGAQSNILSVDWDG